MTFADPSNFLALATDYSSKSLIEMAFSLLGITSFFQPAILKGC